VAGGGRGEGGKEGREAEGGGSQEGMFPRPNTIDSRLEAR